MPESPGVSLPGDLPPKLGAYCCIAWTDMSYKLHVRTTTASQLDRSVVSTQASLARQPAPTTTTTTTTTTTIIQSGEAPF